MTREELIEAIAPSVQQISDMLKEMDHPEVGVSITVEGGKIVDCIRIPDFCQE